MTWNGVAFAGNKSTGESRFIDKDHVEWSLVVASPGGEVGAKEE